MRGRPVAFAVAGLLALAGGLTVQATGLLHGAEGATVDARFHARPADRPADIVVVGVDSDTFSSLRHAWPFPRSWHAAVIDHLREAGAKTIVYDVQFTEPTAPREDLALYRAIGRTPHVVLATTEVDDHGHTNVLGGDANLARIGARAGAANLDGTAGGTLRRVPWGASGLPSLAVAASEVTTGHTVAPSSFPGEGALIDFRGPPGTIASLPYSDVKRGTFDPRAVAGKIVVVGATAPTLQDVHATPASSSKLMSGPEVQANAIWTVVHGLPLHDAPWILGALAILLLALVVPLASLVLRPWFAAAGAIPVAAAYVAACQLAFVHGLLLPVVAPLVALALAATATVGAAAWTEARERRIVAAVNAELSRRVRDATEEIRETQLEVIQRLGQAAESRDHDTGQHIERMSVLCGRLALAVGMSVEEAELLQNASVMHDVGKIGIPDAVLQKPGRFTAEERSVMETHTTIGASILAGSPSPRLQLAEEIARTHHERWDGGGYPGGLIGEQIPLAGRIAAICDVFDALTSSRPYKHAWTIDDALQEIATQRGRHFDPRLVDAFMTLVPDLRAEAEASELTAMYRAPGTPQAPRSGDGDHALDGQPGALGDVGRDPHLAGPVA
jgi:CHASE2 domain-containing sensor protein